MGRFHYGLLTLLLAIPAWAAREIPVDLQIFSASRDFATQPEPRKVYLSQIFGSPFAPSSQWVRMSAATPSSTDPESLLFSWSDFPDAMRALLGQLFQSGVADQGLNSHAGWQVEIQGLKHEAVVLNWNLVVRRVLLRTGVSRMAFVGFRPTFYIPGEGQVDIFRVLTLREVESRVVSLPSPNEYSFVWRQGTQRVLAVNGDGLPFMDRPEWADDLNVEDVAWLPGVVLLRDRTDGGGLESLSGTLWANLQSDPAQASLTFRVGNHAVQLKLPIHGLAQALGALRAHQQFQPIRIGTHQYDGLRPVQLETLIVDTRKKRPSYHFLVRRARGVRRFDELQVVPASQVEAVPKPSPRPRVGSPWDPASVDRLVGDYLAWELENALPNPISQDSFLWFLAQNSPPRLTYAEALVALERLADTYEHPWLRPPHSLSEEAFAQVRCIAGGYRSNTLGRPLFVVHPRLTQGYRFLGGAAASNSQTRTFFLDVGIESAYPVLEVISQSATGKGLLKEILPALRNGSLQVEMIHDPQAPAVQLEQSLNGEVLKLNSQAALGKTIGPMVRTLTLGLRRVPSASAPYKLADLRAAYLAVQKVLMDLLRINPWMAEYAGDLSIPSDTQLMKDWALHSDEIARDTAKRETMLCQRTLELMAQSKPSE